MQMMKYKRFVIAIVLQIFVSISPLAVAGKLAIVIDDIGYRAREDDAIYNLPKEVSVAIIPVAPYATARANKAYEQKRDILIHLPMQPQNSAQLIEAGALFVGMGEDKVARLVESARMQVPYAIGLNNHMGSKATTDRQTMQHLMKALSAQQLFFLDSKTAGNSVAAKVAKEFGIKALERHIFLDDSDALEDVKKQFQQAISYARKNGTAIMIGHPRKHSIAVLETGLSNLPDDIQLVSLSSLWRDEKIEPVKPFSIQFVIEPALSSVPPFNTVPLLRGLPRE
ncbi:divergent polysaccharide deacetylase family protein [Ursidibacter maritimus]|uniref:Divergent polysaccharide deacetylase family protein n=1 Tax=Ursidibacter maritimus TaxID=1331689 RepID=A0A949T736_9PAST|nr:divergent polysaccharide deacetylase family protein [Ursidibacter maritimus]MBV6523892.1 divergent polysaccharide deacetylase family protein [Ursidibacter maritimus]MBV6526256.1 divergent polysaccharide deacetylase family protein [Ursidibacter maritimus]MBV6527690.1 divergent polysaccharide deacetylase family protein [Ursidibacter maritimus]MBV6529549.1 divergent polysaccharide deacetylase family protein [Ursidibacter maritimus]MBV6531851.1 divergent polysaccharide deacetylase family protei